MIESRHVCTALQDQETVMNQYKHDMAVWTQRAATYEEQLRELSTTHTMTEHEFWDIIAACLHKISSLKQDLGEKDSAIEGIGLCCDKLNTACSSSE